MKIQALFSLKDKRKKLICCLLRFLFGALRVKMHGYSIMPFHHLYKDRLLSVTVYFPG